MNSNTTEAKKVKTLFFLGMVAMMGSAKTSTTHSPVYTQGFDPRSDPDYCEIDYSDDEATVEKPYVQDEPFSYEKPVEKPAYEAPKDDEPIVFHKPVVYEHGVIYEAGVVYEKPVVYEEPVTKPKPKEPETYEPQMPTYEPYKPTYQPVE